jgi:anti-sigma B factor antagonist
MLKYFGRMISQPNTGQTYIVFSFPQDLDLYNAETMKQAIARFLESDDRPVIFDCVETEYVDSSGIGVLVYVHGLCLRRKRRFCLTRMRGNVSRTLGLTGLDGVFPIEDDLDDAVFFMEKSGQA